ncbi:MAG: SLC13 family permease [Alphaproteobacteria bacterium]
MTNGQIIIFAILGGVLVFFAWGRWRYDLTAFTALLVGVLTGVVPMEEAFRGFGHPAVITVAAVLVISRALSNSGAVDLVARFVAPATERHAVAHIGVLGALAAGLSAFMNNVGALALLLPVALRSAAKTGRSPAMILMPLSFASILGGLATLIGTPPNIIVATYRAEVEGEAFGMFDFTPVGGVVALAGLLFVTLIGWRLIPKARREKKSPEELFDIADYVTEARVPEGSSILGQSLGEAENMAEKQEATIIGLIRGERRLFGPNRRWRIKTGDVLVIEAPPEAIDKVVTAMGLELVGSDEDILKDLKSEDWTLMEVVVTPRSRIERRTAGGLHLRSRYGVNLLAVSREGRPVRSRLKSFRFRAGDVLLLQGNKNEMPEIVGELGCLPLAERHLQLGRRKWIWVSIAIFAVAVLGATFGLITPAIALAVAVAALVLLNIVSPEEAYRSVDWSVIILLGAMIPIGGAMVATGATELIASAIHDIAGGVSPVVVLVLLLIVTMTLSDVINNAATAVVMAPIAVGIAAEMGASPDPFLMAVAVGASCAFLTPIGHQNNMLIMGPGGYRFGDYWRMGLPLELVVVAVATPLILLIWPF